MNGVPMKFDYSKTINEQLPTFDYYKDRYCSYELELLKDRKEIERLKEDNEYLNKANIELSTEKNRLNNIINELEKWLDEDLKQVYRDAGHRHNLILEVLDKLQELKGSDK